MKLLDGHYHEPLVFDEVQLTVEELLTQVNHILEVGCHFCDYKPITLDDLVWHNKSHITMIDYVQPVR